MNKITNKKYTPEEKVIYIYYSTNNKETVLVARVGENVFCAQTKDMADVPVAIKKIGESMAHLMVHDIVSQEIFEDLIS